MSSIGDDSISTSKQQPESHRNQSDEQLPSDTIAATTTNSEMHATTIKQEVPDIDSLNLDDELSKFLDNQETVHNESIVKTKSLNTVIADLGLPELGLHTESIATGTIATDITSVDSKSKQDIEVSHSSKDISSTQTQQQQQQATNNEDTRDKTSPITIKTESIKETPEPKSQTNEPEEQNSRVSAYARLDFENFTFFVQTLQVVLGRKSNDELLQSSHNAVDVHLSSKKAISRKHAKIFYNFGTQRFEISILGRNGAFVDDLFVEKGITIPLKDGTKIQIGDIPFKFVLPSTESNEDDENGGTIVKQFNPSDAINLRTNIYNRDTSTSKPKSKSASKPKSIIKKDKEKIKLENETSTTTTTKQTKPTPTSTTSTSTGTVTTTTTTAPNTTTQPSTAEARKNSISRRDSLLKIRRLSSARRKSLVGNNDELTEILKDLGVSSIDAISEEDSELLDAQIQSLLDEAEGFDENLMKLTEANESSTATQDENSKEVTEKTEQDQIEENEIHDIEMNLSVLDQEIASLAPLIDAHNQDLMKEKEEKKKQLEQEKKRKQQQHLQRRNSAAKGKPAATTTMPSATATSTPSTSASATPTTSTGTAVPPRTTPLMGKPASIQPPASRLYNRALNGATGLTGTTGIDNKLAATLLSLPAASSASYISKQIIPPRPPPPKLEAPVLPVTSEPSAIRSRPPLRAITVRDSSYLATFDVPKTIEEPSKYPKPKVRKDSTRRQPKKVYSPDEIPEQYRSKPNVTFMMMITSVLKTEAARNGLTINEISEAIKEIYPYFKYCPDGWQFSIAHCIKYNKIYKRIMKRGSEWLYTMDDLYISEREKVRKKQQEMAAAKAKAEALRQEELKQKQRLEAQQATISHNITGRTYTSPYGLPNSRLTQNQYLSQLPYKQPQIPVTTANGQKPKTIAELASEIRRDGVVGSKAPMYFKSQPGSTGPVPTPAAAGGPNTIKAQLAANRSQPQQPAAPSMSDPNTQKSLEYLRKELFVLYRARKLTYDKQTATVLITKALATTIAQVNSIGAKAGCGENALGFLVDKAPQQVSKILDIALTKSIKEHEGNFSRSPSRAATPVPQSQPSPVKTTTPMVPAQPVNVVNKASPPPVQPVHVKTEPIPMKPIANPPIIGTDNPVKAVVDAAAAARNETISHPLPIITNAGVPIISSVSPVKTTPQPTIPVVSNTPPVSTPPTEPKTPSASTSPAPVVSRSTTPALSKPSSFGLSKPPSFKPDSLGRPASLSKPQSFAKPGGSSALSRPPSFLSNKPAYRETQQVKRELEGGAGGVESDQAKKIARTE
ncbi:FHL1 [[Candida] subhashii]|uniref:FHL1 n=1 Tax=[Candida] subhashii TaxID=561895 RepID=A0A8J5QIV3_9ASCO|nr:FHL1 [[Candida] subhashii]KAG7661478.1 FHL1 [[Candida] subhashii]